jgi:hypothetical protein
VSTAQYAQTYGTRLKSGQIAYKGIGHRHWSRRWYSQRWGCWCWYCPCTCEWYYWCGDRDYYLPVRYLTVVPPTCTTMDEQSPDVTPPDGGQVVQVRRGEEIPDLPEPQ